MAVRDDVLAYFRETDKATLKAKDVQEKFLQLTRGQIAGAMWQLEKTGKIKKIERGSFTAVVENGNGTINQ